MANITIQITVLLGITLLIAALIPIQSTCKVLPPGRNRSMWICLAGLIAFAILGYVLFLRLNTGLGMDMRESRLVAIVFLTAATIVFTICTMSNFAAKDVALITALEHAANIDPLTDLYNRRYMMALFEQESARSRSSNTTLSVLLLDIDRFKSINDVFGHPAGDHVLRRISTVLAQNVERKFVGRFGGEEFIILLPNVSQIEATQLAERIRVAVESEVISFQDEPLIPMTISIGVAASSWVNESPDELIALADRALYAAKAGGRNQVSTATGACLDCGNSKTEELFPRSSRKTVLSISDYPESSVPGPALQGW